MRITCASRATAAGEVADQLLAAGGQVDDLLRRLGARGIARGADRGARDRADQRADAGITGARDDRTEYGAGEGTARHRRGRGSCDDAHALMRRDAGDARVKSRLLDGPDMALVAVAIELLVRLPLRRVGDDLGHLLGRRRRCALDDLLRPRRGGHDAAAEGRGGGD